SYVPKRAIAAHRSPNTLKHNMITKPAYFSWITNGIHEFEDRRRIVGRRDTRRRAAYQDPAVDIELGLAVHVQADQFEIGSVDDLAHR
ncbi:MAG TPA: hypothetical protein VN888_05580, partial [Mycobacterium sp.]|nr:hypothetical protein [Mycobacterium sp.]